MICGRSLDASFPGPEKKVFSLFSSHSRGLARHGYASLEAQPLGGMDWEQPAASEAKEMVEGSASCGDF